MMLRPAYVIFSLNTFAAAMLALYIGFGAGLPRPYWAMLTVYITAQPLTGALRSKALFRVLGTILGASVAVLLVPTLVNAPVLLSLAMAIWAALCLYLSLLDRTPRAYVFMLAGYTAAIIGFPSVTAPGEIFDTASSRVEEIILGITCATVVHTIFFPRDVGTVLQGQIAKYLSDARRWISEALSGHHGAREESERQRLASDITELQVLATHLPFDTSNLRTRIGAIRALQDKLAVLLPLLAGVEDRLAGLRTENALPESLTALAADVAAWAAAEAPAQQDGAVLLDRCELLVNQLVPVTDPDWAALLAASALTRLGELVSALQTSRDLAAFIEHPDLETPAHLSATLRGSARRPLHRDHGLSALSAFALGVAVLACCSFWILTGWPEGAIAAMMAAVFSSFFATQDDPAPAILSFIIWTVASLPIAALFMFAVLPAIDGFPLLVVVMAPFFLVAGYFQANPRYYGRAMPLIMGVTGALSLQEVFSADFPNFLNNNLAQIIGTCAALFSTQIFRSLNAGWSARRILRRGWRDLAALATSRRGANRDAWTSTMLDRVGLLVSRLPAADPDDELKTADAMIDMRVGLNILDLKDARQSMAAPQAAIDAALDSIGCYYALRGAGRSEALPTGLLSSVDAAVLEIDKGAPGLARRRGLVALAGLRRTLFPGAPPFAQEMAP